MSLMPSPTSNSGIVYSLVVPVYRNEDTICELIERMDELSQAMGRLLEVVLVVDGSPDRSAQLLVQGLAGANFPVELIELSRNFGSFTAIRAGLAAARGRYIAVMAADLQEPMDLMMAFFRTLETGDTDIALGTRRSRQDPWSARAASGVFWGIHRRLVQPEVPAGGVDVFACSARVRDQLVTMQEAHTSLIGLLFWVGFTRRVIPYDRLPRPSGRSAWSFRRKVRYMLDSIFAFTDLPVVLLIWAGAFGICGSFAVASIVFVAWLTGHIQVLGYTPLVLLQLASISVTLFALGVIGSYVWRTYENSKRRPLFVEARRRSFGKEM
jgi:glycosyltransferase involved in cell wall biosynthesis